MGIEDSWKSTTGKIHKTTVSIPAGGKATVVDLKQSGAIGSLRIAMEPWTKETFKEVA